MRVWRREGVGVGAIAAEIIRSTIFILRKAVPCHRRKRGESSGPFSLSLVYMVKNDASQF